MRFLILFVLGILLVSPVALAESENQGFFAKVRAFFAGDDGGVQLQEGFANERGDTTREQVQANPGQGGESPPETEISGIPGSIGGSVPPSMFPPGLACNPCRTVVCGPGVEYEPEYQDREDVDDEIFVCPDTLASCRETYGASCRIIGCVEPIGCTAKVHTCYDYGDVKPMPLPTPRSSSGASVGYAGSEDASITRSVNPSNSGDGGCFSGGRWHEPGEPFKSDCNTCVCDEDGNVQCTLEACAPDPVCGNGLCEAGEASFCPGQTCPEGEECPAIGAPCYIGSCEKDCGQSITRPVDPPKKIRCEGTLEECTEKYGVCSCGWQ